jgi:hypothetical protein
MEAAEKVAPHLGRLQRLVFEAVKAAGSAGLTTDELAIHLRVDRGSVQPRTSELRLMGLIHDGGDRRKNASGVRAIVWVATEGDQ